MLLELTFGGVLALAAEIEAPSRRASVNYNDLVCAARAVLIESTIPKESVDGQAAVAEALKNRTGDGRWGITVCDTVNMKYKVVRTQIVRKRVRGKIRKVPQTKTSYVYDISSVGMKRFDSVKGTAAQEGLATVISYDVLRGEYQLPGHLNGALHWMYRAKSAKGGVAWFDCIAESLGQAAQGDFHVFYKDADYGTLAVRWVEKAKCRKYIEVLWKAEARKQQKLELLSSIR